MTIEVLAFGIVKDIFGSPAISVEIGENPTINDLNKKLQQQYPALHQLASYMIARNNEYARNEDTIQARDEVAIIPPVSGG